MQLVPFFALMWEHLHQLQHVPPVINHPALCHTVRLLLGPASLHLLLLFGYKLRDNRLVGALRVDDFSARDARVAVLKLAAAVDGELCAHTNPRSTHTESNGPLDT